MSDALIAGIEAGGTKILCAVARKGGAVLEQARIATQNPDDTIAEIQRFYAAAERRHGPLAAAGIASFGPLDLDPASTTYGCLTGTPKAGWSGVDIRSRIASILQAPTVIDTDVNCAAVAEMQAGAARGLDRICYVTIGTGIGVGIVESGRTNAGTGHPEAGHIRVPRAPGDDFAGVCPSHGDCLEGLACGPAMHARWGCAAEDLPGGHIGWAFAAHYIAALCTTLTYTVRPRRIILGGGVLERASLIEAVRNTYRDMTAGYALDRYSAAADTFIVPPHLVDPSPGLVGALAMAAGLADRSRAS